MTTCRSESCSSASSSASSSPATGRRSSSAGGTGLGCAACTDGSAACAFAAAGCPWWLVAIGTTHARNGFWNGAGGYEFNLLILAVATALAATGGGRVSLDNALGWADNLSGLWWGVGVLAVAALGAIAMLTIGRRPETPAVAEPERDQTLRAA